MAVVAKNVWTLQAVTNVIALKDLFTIVLQKNAKVSEISRSNT